MIPSQSKGFMPLQREVSVIDKRKSSANANMEGFSPLKREASRLDFADKRKSVNVPGVSG